MWYEILPSAAIILVAVTFPHASAYVINKLVIGNCYKRSLLTKEMRGNYLRDQRLSKGDPYKVMGLDSIPNN